METEKDTKRPGFRCLYLASTRERALVAKAAFENKGLTVSLSMGGMSTLTNLSAWDFQEPEVVVGTIGRIHELSPKSDYWANLKYLIVDDAQTVVSTMKKQLEELLPQFGQEKQVTVIANGDYDISELKFEDSVDYFKEAPTAQQVTGKSIPEVVNQLVAFLSKNLNKKNIIYFPNEFFVTSVVEILKKEYIFARWLIPNDSTKKRIAFFHEFQSEPNGILISTTDLPYLADNVITVLGDEESKFSNVTHRFDLGASSTDANVKKCNMETEITRLAYAYFVAKGREDAFDDFAKQFKELGVSKHAFMDFIEKNGFSHYLAKMNQDFVKKLEENDFVRH